MSCDVQGKKLKVNQKVAVATKLTFDIVTTVVKTVTRIEGEKVYLDNSPRALKFPERICIIN